MEPSGPLPSGGVSRTVLLVDDHDLIRLGIECLLRRLDGISCRVLQGRSIAEAKDQCAAEPQIDLILLDLNVCDAKGLQGLRVMREAFPTIPVVVLTGTQDEFVVRQARAMGARGYLLKSWSPTRLQNSFTRVLLHPAEAVGGDPADLHAIPPAGVPPRQRVAELGTRHVEILELILSGCNNREIASATGLSVGTIKNYVSDILLTLDVRSRGHLISLFH